MFCLLSTDTKQQSFEQSQVFMNATKTSYERAKLKFILRDLQSDRMLLSSLHSQTNMGLAMHGKRING